MIADSSTPDDELLVMKDGGGSLNLTCVARALPPHSLVWYHNGEKVFTNDSMKVEGHVLRIPVVSVVHAGIFQCSASTVHPDHTHTTSRMWLLRIIEKEKGGANECEYHSFLSRCWSSSGCTAVLS